MKFCVICQTYYNIITDLEEMRKQYGGLNMKIVIKQLLEKDDIQLNAKNADMLKKSVEFKNLNDEEQKIILDKLENVEEKKEATTEHMKISVYYFCPNCYYYELMKPTTLIYSKSYNSQYKLQEKLHKMVDNPILQRTKKYKCINTKCPSHINKKDAEIVMLPDRKNNKLTFICNTCNAQWH